MVQDNGTFKESAIERGVAYTENDAAISGMGVDARDIDNDGLPDIFETALLNETMPLFRNLGEVGFEEITFASGVAHASLAKTGWSNGIYDFNNDGRKDLFAACGQVMDAEGSLPATLTEDQVEELFKRTEKEEGYSLTVNLPNQTIDDKHGLMFKFEIARSRKEVLLKGLDDIGTTLQHEPDITAYEKTHAATATMYDAVDVKYYSNGR